MSRTNHIPSVVDANLGARLAPFSGTPRAALEDLDVENSRAVSPRRERQGQERHGKRGTFISDLKLLFAALGAGGSVVPLGDNGRTTRLLSAYAASLRDH
ncbi:MAG TPA: hypothetical protein VMF52_02640 [Steroidobacteraceae bacterium]|nr:hypothetical protein [Steroidobacteraceae bacterium]